MKKTKKAYGKITQFFYYSGLLFVSLFFRLAITRKRVVVQCVICLLRYRSMKHTFIMFD